ncbi:unnamed protein product, partial [Lampetra planeri]
MRARRTAGGVLRAAGAFKPPPPHSSEMSRRGSEGARRSPRADDTHCRHVVAVRKARPGGSIAAPGLATGPARRVAGGRDVALSLRRKAAVPDRAVPGLAVPCLAGPVQLCPGSLRARGLLKREKNKAWPIVIAIARSSSSSSRSRSSSPWRQENELRNDSLAGARRGEGIGAGATEAAGAWFFWPRRPVMAAPCRPSSALLASSASGLRRVTTVSSSSSTELRRSRSRLRRLRVAPAKPGLLAARRCDRLLIGPRCSRASLAALQTSARQTQQGRTLLRCLAQTRERDVPWAGGRAGWRAVVVEDAAPVGPDGASGVKEAGIVRGGRERHSGGTATDGRRHRWLGALADSDPLLPLPSPARVSTASVSTALQRVAVRHRRRALKAPGRGRGVDRWALRRNSGAEGFFESLSLTLSARAGASAAAVNASCTLVCSCLPRGSPRYRRCRRRHAMGTIRSELPRLENAASLSGHGGATSDGCRRGGLVIRQSCGGNDEVPVW